MKYQIRVSKIEGEPFNVMATKENYLIIYNLLKSEKQKIIEKFKEYKSAGLIGSIFYPRNKIIQNELDELVKKKRLMTSSMEKILKLFK
jgi:hypothetical protein